MRALFGILVMITLGCGDDDRRPSADAAVDTLTRDTSIADSSTSDSSRPDASGSLRGFKLDYDGTTTISYNFLDTVTFETQTPPDPFPDIALITANSDFTQISIETVACDIVADYDRTTDDGGQVYEIDVARSSCPLTVTSGEMVRMSEVSGLVRWNEDSLSIFFSGDGEITNSTSIFIVEFEGV